MADEIETPKSSDAILASAAAGTDPKALSNASETAPPTGANGNTFTDKPGLIPGVPPSTATFTRDFATAPEPAAVDDRIAALEADIAFLRQQFGWPSK